MSQWGDEIKDDQALTVALEASSAMLGALDINDLAALTDLVEFSRTRRGRELLTGALEDALLLLPFSSGPELLLRLQLLRNLLLGDSNRSSFFFRSGPGTVVDCSKALRGDSDVARAVLQTLGNAALAEELHCAQVWDALFPGPLWEFAACKHDGVVDPLWALLHTCCSIGEGCSGRLEELCHDDLGLPILVELVTTASIVGYKEQCLEWLLFRICVAQEKFETLFTALCSTEGVNESDVGESGTEFNARHAFLLGVLSRCLTSGPEEFVVSSSFAHHVFNLHNHASETVDFACRATSALPTGCPAIDVLGYSLVLLKDICAWKCPSWLPPWSEAKAPVDSLLQTGIVKCLLRYLYKLEPPSANRKLMASGQGDQLPAVATGAVCPYNGYRRDLVAVIANCLHKRKEVQDEVRQLSGIALLLQQCVVDEENPCLKECALLAIKELLDGNVENQQEVSELQMQLEPILTTEIAEILVNTI